MTAVLIEKINGLSDVGSIEFLQHFNREHVILYRRKRNRLK
jgi:hypothetical protein